MYTHANAQKPTSRSGISETIKSSARLVLGHEGPGFSEVENCVNLSRISPFEGHSFPQEIVPIKSSYTPMPPHDTASSLACAVYKQTNTLVFLPVRRCKLFVGVGEGRGVKIQNSTLFLGK